MIKTDFLANLIDHSQAEGFSFLTPDGNVSDPKRMSEGRQMVVRLIQGAAFGLLGGIVGYTETRKQELIRDLTAFSAHGDLAGINLTQGTVILRIVIDADGLTDDTLVGRFTLIHESAHNFRRYGLSTFSGNMSTHVHVILLFSSHERADAFGKRYGKKCSQWSFWKKVLTNPWIIDLEREELIRFQVGAGIGAAKLKAALFRPRQDSMNLA